jgi:hypothetical protein
MFSLFKSKPVDTARHHIVITGTGRNGTTFLVELLTHLGLDTGFKPKDFVHIMKSHSRAGLELDIRSETAPYIIKSPWFCGYSDEIINNPRIALDHVFLPFRDMDAALASRARVVNEHPPSDLKPSEMIGGLMGTDSVDEQRRILEQNLFKLLNALADSFVPVTLIAFPRLVKDPEYLYKKILPAIGKIRYPQFKASFDAVSHPEFVHEFPPAT